jgi:hypothetical protein
MTCFTVPNYALLRNICARLARNIAERYGHGNAFAEVQGHRGFHPKHVQDLNCIERDVRD